MKLHNLSLLILIKNLNRVLEDKIVLRLKVQSIWIIITSG